jgi:hypothetical protein
LGNNIAFSKLIVSKIAGFGFGTGSEINVIVGSGYEKKTFISPRLRRAL